MILVAGRQLSYFPYPEVLARKLHSRDYLAFLIFLSPPPSYFQRPDNATLKYCQKYKKIYETRDSGLGTRGVTTCRSRTCRSLLDSKGYPRAPLPRVELGCPTPLHHDGDALITVPKAQPTTTNFKFYQISRLFFNSHMLLHGHIQKIKNIY